MYNKSDICKAAYTYATHKVMSQSEAMKLAWYNAKNNKPFYESPIIGTDKNEEDSNKHFDDYFVYVDESYESDELIQAQRLSIPTVYDVKEEKEYVAKEFFKRDENELILWRRNLQEAISTNCPRLICPKCKQMVKISGHKTRRGRVCYFAHYKDSYDCKYKTSTNKTKKEIEALKYGLVQESERHIRLKELIRKSLCGVTSKELGVTNVECEKRIKSKIPYLNYRRPDVYADWNGRHLVFELQLSTTFVSVIVDRDIFYRLNDYDIIWVFNFDDNQEYVNLYNLMCKDIYYANKRNVFIFDKEAQEKSEHEGQLILKCRWLDENDKWTKDILVTLTDLEFDDEYHKPYIFDADVVYLKKHPEAFARRKSIENTRQDLINALIERKEKEKQDAIKKEKEISDIRIWLKNNGETVEPYKNKTKYGFKYKNRIILQPKYTSIEQLKEGTYIAGFQRQYRFYNNTFEADSYKSITDKFITIDAKALKMSYYEVAFNRKYGLVRRDGVEVVPIEYRNIFIISDVYDIILAQYKCVDLHIQYSKLRYI